MIRRAIIVGVLIAATAAIPAAHADVDGDMLSLETQSGRIWCEVTTIQRNTPTGPTFGRDSAWCQGPFEQNADANQVGTSGDGAIHWQGANMSSASARLKMQYGQTYNWGNWTVYADATGTRFTNTRTGHGMFVSVKNVYGF